MILRHKVDLYLIENRGSMTVNYKTNYSILTFEKMKIAVEMPTKWLLTFYYFQLMDYNTLLVILRIILPTLCVQS
jgi:hypothetical protein